MAKKKASKDSSNPTKIQHIKLNFKSSFTSPLVSSSSSKNTQTEHLPLNKTPRATKRKLAQLSAQITKSSLEKSSPMLASDTPSSPIKLRINTGTKAKKRNAAISNPTVYAIKTDARPFRIKLSSSSLEKQQSPTIRIRLKSSEFGSLDLSSSQGKEANSNKNYARALPIADGISTEAEIEANFLAEKNKIAEPLPDESRITPEDESTEIKSNPEPQDTTNPLNSTSHPQNDLPNESRERDEISEAAHLESLEDVLAKASLVVNQQIKAEKLLQPDTLLSETPASSTKRALRRTVSSNQITSPNTRRRPATDLPQAPTLQASDNSRSFSINASGNIPIPSLFSAAQLSQTPTLPQNVNRFDNFINTFPTTSSNQEKRSESFEIPDSDLITELFDSIYNAEIKLAKQLTITIVEQNHDINALRPIRLRGYGNSIEFIDKIKYLTSSTNTNALLNQSAYIKGKLESYKANKSAKVEKEDEAGLWTPLIAACFYGRTKIISMLLQTKKCEVEKKDTLYGTTALGWTAYGGHPNSLRRLFVESDALLNTTNKFGQSPFDLVPDPENPKWADFISGDIESIRKKNEKYEKHSQRLKKLASEQPRLEIRDNHVGAAKEISTSREPAPHFALPPSLKWDDIPEDQKKALLSQNYPDIQVIVHVFEALLNYNDKEKGNISLDFEELPDSSQYPEYYEVFTHPISLEVIAHRIFNGAYLAFAQFDSDVQRVFHNACFFNVYGSEIYTDAVVMLSIYNEIRHSAVTQFNTKFNLSIAEQAPPVGRYITRLMHGDFDLAVGDCVLINTGKEAPQVAIILRLSVSGSRDRTQLIDGMWFMHPSETGLEQIRSSFPHEVFLNPTLFTGIHARHVISRCVVLPYKRYVAFYPKDFEKKDIYVCEYSFIPSLKKLVPLTVWPSPSPLQQPPDHYLSFIQYPRPLVLKRIPLNLWGSDTHLPDIPRVDSVAQGPIFQSSRSGISHNLNLSHHGRINVANPLARVATQPHQINPTQPPLSNSNLSAVQLDNSSMSQQSIPPYSTSAISSPNPMQLHNKNLSPLGAGSPPALAANPHTQSTQPQAQQYYHPQSLPDQYSNSSFTPSYLQADPTAQPQTPLGYNSMYQQQLSELQQQTLPQFPYQPQLMKPLSHENHQSLQHSQLLHYQMAPKFQKFTTDDAFSHKFASGLNLLTSQGEKAFLKQLLQDTANGKLLTPLASVINSGFYCLQIADSDGCEQPLNAENNSNLQTRNRICHSNIGDDLSMFQHWKLDLLFDDNHSVQVPGHVSNILLRPVYPLFLDSLVEDEQEVSAVKKGFTDLESCECSLNLEPLLPRLLDVEIKVTPAVEQPISQKPTSASVNSQPSLDQKASTPKSGRDNGATASVESGITNSTTGSSGLNNSSKFLDSETSPALQNGSGPSPKTQGKDHPDPRFKTLALQTEPVDGLGSVGWRKNLFFSIPLLPGLNIIKLTLIPPKKWPAVFRKLNNGEAASNTNSKDGADTKNDNVNDGDHNCGHDWELVQPIVHTIFITRV